MCITEALSALLTAFTLSLIICTAVGGRAASSSASSRAAVGSYKSEVYADEGYIYLDAIEMTDDEIDIACGRVRQVLRAA